MFRPTIVLQDAKQVSGTRHALGDWIITECTEFFAHLLLETVDECLQPLISEGDTEITPEIILKCSFNREDNCCKIIKLAHTFTYQKTSLLKSSSFLLILEYDPSATITKYRGTRRIKKLLTLPQFAENNDLPVQTEKWTKIFTECSGQWLCLVRWRGGWKDTPDRSITCIIFVQLVGLFCRSLLLVLTYNIRAVRNDSDTPEKHGLVNRRRGRNSSS